MSLGFIPSEGVHFVLHCVTMFLICCDVNPYSFAKWVQTLQFDASGFCFASVSNFERMAAFRLALCSSLSVVKFFLIFFCFKNIFIYICKKIFNNFFAKVIKVFEKQLFSFTF